MLPANRQGDGDENRHSCRVVDEGRDGTSRDHQSQKQSQLTVAAKLDQPVADYGDGARFHQPATQNEHGRDRDCGLVAKARDRFMNREKAGPKDADDHQGGHDENGDHVHTEFLGDEKHQSDKNDQTD